MKDLLSFVDDETQFLIDIDGVCLDTEQRIAKLAKEIGWKEAFKTINWHEHIFSSEQINGSLDILREVQQRLKRIQLITQNHTKEEELEKLDFFRQNGILIPMMSVPPKIEKWIIAPPSFYNGNVVLVDDREKNVISWNNAGGIGVHFTEEESSKELVKVKSLDFLRKVR